MPSISTLAYAVSTLTITDNFDDTETVIIGGKTYTGKTTLSNTDGFFKIEGTKTLANGKLTLANLAAAINLGTDSITPNGTGAGTTYAAATTAGLCRAIYVTGNATLIIQARVPGAIGNQITTTETHGEGSWTSTVMASGSGSIHTALEQIEARGQLNADLISTFAKMHKTVA